MSSRPFDVAALERLARLLDSAVRIPGTNVRVGLDALIGLIAGVGDTATALVSGVFILAAIRAGAPKRVIAEMAANILLDWLIGAIPIAGDIFDVAFRANARNLALLRAALADRPPPCSPRP